MIRWISIVDLLSFEESRDLLLENDEERLMNLLYDVGMNVGSMFEMQWCLHRPLSYIAGNKNPVVNWRFVSEERKDQEWQDSGNCTRENKLEIIGRKDLGFQKELVAMGSYPNFTGIIIENMKGNSAKSDRSVSQPSIDDLEGDV